MRKRLPVDVEALTHGKARLENQANEMNRTAVHYEDSYDAVENTITERFASYKQQLIQAELAARSALSSLRESGDVTLTGARKSFLSKLNGITYHLLVFQSLQHGGADYEILESRSQLDTCMKAEVASIAGRGFDVRNTGEFKVESLDIVLDLQSGKDPLQSFKSTAAAAGGRGPSPLKITDYGTSPTPASQQVQLPLRLTFPVDEDVQATVQPDGVFLRCVARQRGGVQIGVRSRETFKDIMERYRKDEGRVSWRVRLGNVRDTFIGVVEKLHESSASPEGFYWKPAVQGVVDGSIGTPTSNVRNLPVCRTGDVVRFLYDGNNRCLQVFLNETNCGVILNDVHAGMSACFIFFPGETLTLLF
ncbi:zinc-finger protein, conserved [Strigomonas culicis]|nr:zinc-finger protein, conserved [Strigomonas culicis]|eukprot:EPY29189.1 zinc-finger protein, conserved [Strigomonas culicis]